MASKQDVRSEHMLLDHMPRHHQESPRCPLHPNKTMIKISMSIFPSPCAEASAKAKTSGRVAAKYNPEVNCIFKEMFQNNSQSPLI